MEMLALLSSLMILASEPMTYLDSLK